MVIRFGSVEHGDSTFSAGPIEESQRAARNQQVKNSQLSLGASAQHGRAQQLTTAPPWWGQWGRGEQAEGGNLKRPPCFRAGVKGVLSAAGLPEACGHCNLPAVTVEGVWPVALMSRGLGPATRWQGL